MKQLYLGLYCLYIAVAAAAQDSSSFVTTSANAKLADRSASWIKNWGQNRRKEWDAPVRVPVLWLDSARAGLRPYQQGGGNESKSLRLTNLQGKEWVLRSVNKSRDDVIADEFRKTFIEYIIRDGLSSSHPYGALALPEMMKAAGILHPEPRLVYVPAQPALDSFNNRFGNDLYMLEQRPDGDWSEALNFGNCTKFSSTEKVIEELLEDNRSAADQFAFIKARLFDMFIGDWDRHEDNWRWCRQASGKQRLYIPIARDRDQAFYTHNGKLLDKLLPAAGFTFMHHFDTSFGTMHSFNKPERYIDRFFANAMSLSDWLQAAAALQQDLTDSVIYRSLREMPDAVTAIAAEEMAQKLIARRKQLPAIAASYYSFLAKEVDIRGSHKKEYFDISREQAGVTTVKIFRVDENGSREVTPFYHRSFRPEETRELRVFGLNSDDVFSVSGSSPIVLRIIGGAGTDTLLHNGDRVHMHDDHQNFLQGEGIRKHLSAARRRQDFIYRNYEYDSKGILPAAGFNWEDRIYAGLNWSKKTYRWNRHPYASLHNIGVVYSFTQSAPAFTYNGIFPGAAGSWDLFLDSRYDIMVWRNFPGAGNNSTWNDKEKLFYQLRSREWNTSAGLSKSKGKNTVAISLVHQFIDNRYDKGRYADKVFSYTDPAVFAATQYGGLRVRYMYVSVNDRIVPEKGFTCLLNGALLRNFSRHYFFQQYAARLQAWLPLSRKFSLCIRGGGETIAGNNKAATNALAPEHALLSGFDEVRGYRPERFWGRSAVYNNNELRFITNLRSYWLNAKIGLLAFADAGRVWQPGENSSTLHSSWGGGFLIAPFHFTSFTVTYGRTKETKLVQCRMVTLF
ncbi:MAG: ShlB/FhaC/HecB family hemolysin secretion/activation protein [Chitinophagaceae bacterium]